MGVSEMAFTRHAKHRMQQRHIDWQMIELALAYGRELPARGHCRAYVMSSPEINRHRKRIDLSDLKGLVVIVGRADEVVTCYRRVIGDESKTCKT